MDHLPDLRLVSVVASPYSGRTTLLRSLRRDPEPTAATSLQSLGADRKSGDADGHSLAGFSALSLRASVLGDQAPEDTPRAGPSSPPFCVRFLDDHQSGPDFCMADGALVVVDPVYGLDLRAQELLRLALQNQLKPALFVNKVDALVEAKASREDVYQALARLVESVNDVTAGHPKTALGDIKLYPQRGTVAFGSGRFGWAFTTSQFASRYSKKFGIDRDKLTERFWVSIASPQVSHPLTLEDRAIITSTRPPRRGHKITPSHTRASLLRELLTCSFLSPSSGYILP